MKSIPTPKSSLSSKLKYAFDLVGVKVKLVKVPLGLDEQYDYKSMISVMPEGLWVGEFRHPEKQQNNKYDIYAPDGENLSVDKLFSRMFDKLATVIIQNRLDRESLNLDYTFDPPTEEEFPY